MKHLIAFAFTGARLLIYADPEWDAEEAELTACRLLAYHSNIVPVEFVERLHLNPRPSARGRAGADTEYR